MILPNGATVAVLDGSKMRLYRNKGHEPAIELAALPGFRPHGGEAGSGARHRSSAANPDGRRLAEDNFAAAASEHLNRGALSNQIEKLLIIADARTLGEIRRHFHPALQDRVVGEIHKDLTGHAVKDIEAAIQSA